MKTALKLLAVAVFLAPSLSAAQSITTVSTDRFGIPQSDGELSLEVQRYVSRGDQLGNRLRFDAAAKEYLRAADAARQDGHLPSLTRWKAAGAYYNDNNFVAGATVLDQLADEAAGVGDLEIQALAIYYSAWLNGKAGRKIEATTRITRLESLLRSRYMPLAVRDRLNTLLRTSKDVAEGN